jgi:hypothetical protein
MTLNYQFIFDFLVLVAYYELYVICVYACLTKPTLLIYNEGNAVDLHFMGTVLVNGGGGYIDPVKNLVFTSA